MVGFDGASMGGRCPKCGRRVLQDSQGNWFDADEIDEKHWLDIGLGGMLIPYEELPLEKDS